MADQLKFANASFATFGMLPDDDEDLNAIWGRKAANAAVKTYGQWSTIVLEPLTVDGGGIATIYFDSLGFVDLPTVDLYQVRGGTEAWKVPVLSGETYGDSKANGVLMSFNPASVLRTYRRYFLLYCAPDWHRDGDLAEYVGGLDQGEHGTFLIRLRGN